MTLAAFAAAATALPAWSATAKRITEDTVLTQDTEWGLITFYGTYKVNLNGYKLTIKSATQNAITGSQADDIGMIVDGVDGSEVSLPDGYEKLEYIQSTGTQYIDTGYKNAKNSTADIRVAYTASTPNGSVFGQKSLDKLSTVPLRDPYAFCSYVGSGYFYTGLGSSSATPSQSSGKATQNTVYDIHVSKNGENYATPVGGSKISLGTGQAMKGNLNNYLFAMNEKGKANYHIAGKVWSCVIKEGSTVKRNFVPARRKSDNKVGMYDIVGNTFYPPKSGEFTAGPAIAPSSGGIGELHIVVDDGASKGVQRVKFGGKLKFVKSGGGTLVMSSTEAHDYKGGTEIQEGVLKVNTDTAGTATAGVFGAGGETVSVGASGTLDLGGNSANLANYVFGVAKGGKIINSGADTATAIKVSGVFSPVATAGDFVVAPQNGAVIDFLLCDSFPVVSPSFSFVSGRTYPLNIEPRTAALSALARSTDATGKSNGYLLGWDAKPANVEFELQNVTDDRYRLQSNGNGLLLKYVFGLGIILK